MHKKSLKETAYKRISEFILNENLKPGDMLPPEQSLTKIAKASRTPIREALSMLEQEGVIEIVPRRGTFITQISFKDVKELFQLREAIEGTAARIAAMNIDQEKLSEIEELFAKAMIVEDQELKQKLFDECDDQLHDFVLQQSGNKRLIQVSKSYTTILKIEIKISNTIPNIVDKFQKDHAAIIKAFRDKDPAAAERTMRKHVAHVYKNILLAYEKNM